MSRIFILPNATDDLPRSQTIVKKKTTFYDVRENILACRPLQDLIKHFIFISLFVHRYGIQEFSKQYP
jgi:hypothetical protein